MEGGEAGRFAQAGDGFENNDLFNEDSPELTRSLAEPRFDAGGSGAASSVEQSTRSFSNMSRLLQKAVSYSTTVFQVFSSDPVSVNLAVFELWIRGLREEQVVYFQRTNLGVASESDHAECELLLLLYRNVIDQYRMLHVLEEFLVYPKLLQRQLQVQLSPQIREYMVDRYFEISDSVIRELLGKKLTTRARKDLYEVSELTKNLIPSCRRQFDNLRRIFNMLDEKNFEGNLPAAIVEQFMLRWDMAERYTCIVFLLYNRFNLQSNKKKTCFIPLFDLEYCAAIMILFWVTETTYTSSTEDIKRFTGDQYFQAQDNVVLPSFTEDDQGEDDGGQNELDDEEEASDESDEMVELDDDEDEEAGDIVDETDVGIDEGGGSGQEERIHAKAANRRSVRAGELSQRLLNTPRLSSRLLERRRTTSLNRPVVPEYQKPPGNTSLDISPHLIIKWRMIKNHFFGTRKLLDSTVKAILNGIGPLLPSQMKNAMKKLRIHYKMWFRSLLTIGSGLAQAKELRDFFEDVIVLLCEPLYENVGLSLEGLVIMLSQTRLVVSKLEFIQRRNLHNEWKALTDVCSRIVERLYITLLETRQAAHT